MTLSPELAALRDEAMRTSCISWAIQKRWTLGPGLDRSGPCPKCGGEDRFSIHTGNDLFNCRRCGISGSGVIDLVMQTEDVPFVRACEIITGRKASEPVSEQRMDELRREAEAKASKQAADANAYREKARRGALDIWQRRGEAIDTAAARDLLAYLRMRAVDLEGGPAPLASFTTLRVCNDLDWTEEYEDPETLNKGWRTLHVGPAMLGLILLPSRMVIDGDPLGRFGGVHQTWLDLGTDKGKLVLPPDEKGRERPSKKVRGSKKGGAIPLFTPPHPRRLVMGEGIETTLTPLVHAFEEDTAYWAGIDIGNIGGKALRVDGRQIHDEPDLEDLDCFIPPDWCEEFVLLGEGDDAGVHSREKCQRGLKRAKQLRDQARKRRPLPELRPIYVPPPGEGQDLNDAAMQELRETSHEGT